MPIASRHFIDIRQMMQPYAGDHAPLFLLDLALLIYLPTYLLNIAVDGRGHSGLSQQRYVVILYITISFMHHKQQKINHRNTGWHAKNRLYYYTLYSK